MKEGDLGGSPSGDICVLEEGGRGHTMAGTAGVRGQGTLGRFQHVAEDMVSNAVQKSSRRNTEKKEP